MLTVHGTAEWGLFDVLDRASDVVGIASGDALVDASLMRLLLAVDVAATGDGIEATQWVTRHSGRFELFDSAEPFWQNPAMAAYWELPGAKSPASSMIRPNGSPESIVHSPDSAMGDALGVAITPAEAARALVLRQMFSTGGIQSFPASKAFGLKSSSARSTVANQAPLVYVEGTTLADTLTASRVPGPTGTFQFSWPRGQDPYTDGAPTGVVDTLTWQARSILLNQRGDGMVDSYLCSDGIRYGDLHPDLLPHTTFEQRTKDAPWTARAPHFQRAGWRQLLDAYAAGSPGILSNLPTGPRQLRLIGLSSFQGRLDGHVDDRLPIPHINRTDAGRLSAAIADTYREVSSTVGVAGAALGSSEWGDRRRADAMRGLPHTTRNIVLSAVSGDLPVEDALTELSRTGYQAADTAAAGYAHAYPALSGRLHARITARAAKTATQTKEKS